MTWTGQLTVKSVTDTAVDAVAIEDETWSSKRYTGVNPETGESQYEDIELPTITSNTEGKITGLSLTIELGDGHSLALKPGDRIQVTGHFS